MGLKEKIILLAKRISAGFQKATDSFARHNAQYEQPGKVEAERQLIERNERENIFNNQEYKLGVLLAKYPNVRDVCVDIGSGAGWFSYKFSGYFKKVCAIEPSAKALEISQSFYPPQKYPNIEWRNGLGEQVLSSLNFNSPALFFTGVVLSHLRDQEVIAICRQINRLALPGSILCLNECWGPEWHQNMWHVRTQSWWQQQLPGWELDFHGPAVQNVPGRHKGIHGVKVK